jgi:serine/threonine-protein kinase
MTCPTVGKQPSEFCPRNIFKSRRTLQRLALEARVLAGLDHPNIARLLESGESPAPYLVSELPDGIPIKRYWQGLSLKRSVQFFLRVCDVMQFAHGRMLLHRDLKPSNILAAAAGEPKILNFGVAKVFPDSQDSLDPTAFLFTPDYASPEQFRCERLGVASDVYSLGAVLYELLTGQPPHVTTGVGPAEMTRLIVSVDPLRPSDAVAPAFRRRLRGDLDYIVSKALQKDPARRYSSVESMAADLRSYLRGVPAVGRKVNPFVRGWKFLRRNPAAAAGLAWAIAIVGVASWQDRLTREHFQESRELTGQILRQVGNPSSICPAPSRAANCSYARGKTTWIFFPSGEATI